MAHDRADPVRVPRPVAAHRLVRAGLIDAYLIRNAARPFVVLLLVVMAAMMLERALRLINEMAASGADLTYLGPLLLQLAPYYLDLAISFALLAALALLIARLDERLELEAMFASGLSLSRIAAPLLALGLAISGFSLFSGGWLEPHGRYAFRMMRIEALNSASLGQMQPRAIYHPTANTAVTFDGFETGGGVAGVFLWERQEDGEEAVFSGGADRIGYFAPQRLFAVDFGPGRYVISHGDRLPRQIEFDRLAFRETLRLRDSTWVRGWDQKELTLPELHARMRDPARRVPLASLEAEFYARWARAFIVLLVPILALPLAVAIKREGRALGILLCAALLALSHHGLNFAKKLAVLEAMPAAVAIFGFVAIYTALVLAVFVSARRLPSESPVHALLNAIARLPLRLPRRARRTAGVASRTTTGRYLQRQLGKWILVAMLFIFGLLQMVDLVERGDDFVERGMGLPEIARYALLRVPPTLQQTLPIAALAGALTAFAVLAGRHELTSLRTAGVSQWRLLRMAAPVFLLLSAGGVLLMELAVPASQQRLAVWWQATSPPAKVEAHAPRWFRIGPEIVRAGSAADDGTSLQDIRIFRRDAGGRLAGLVTADRANFAPTGWTLSAVETLRFDVTPLERLPVEQLAWYTPLRPRDVVTTFAGTPSLSAAAALRGLADAAPSSVGTSPLTTRLYRSFSEPLAPFVMLLFALPLAYCVPGQRSWWPLAYAVGAGFVYLVADGLLAVAAQTGYIFPAAGAFTAPFFGFTIGLLVLIYGER